jgi:hypothetical protein
VYINTAIQGVKIYYSDGIIKETKELVLDEKDSKIIFERTGTIAKIEVAVIK